jgi:hypothetical protein
MTSQGRRAGMALLALVLVATAAHAGDAKKLDKGLLDPAWFGPQVEFRTTDDIDYVWVKPGFSVKGKKLMVDAWSDAQLLGEDRDAKDSAKASELTELMPSRLRGALAASLSGVAETSKDSGDIVVSGRIVDCNAGSKAAKFLVGMGAGAATATFDIKMVDKASGELVAAIHHRVVSGTSMSEIDDKVAKWLEEFGGELKADLSIAAKGKVAKK